MLETQPFLTHSSAAMAKMAGDPASPGFTCRKAQLLAGKGRWESLPPILVLLVAWTCLGNIRELGISHLLPTWQVQSILQLPAKLARAAKLTITDHSKLRHGDPTKSGRPDNPSSGQTDLETSAHPEFFQGPSELQTLRDFVLGLDLCRYNSVSDVGDLKS